MAYSTDSFERYLIAVYTDQKTWPQLLPFRQPMAAENSSRFFVVAVFVSMAVHAFIAYLLCVVVTDRTTVVGPTAPSIGTPLIVSLVSLPTPTTASHDGLDREAVSAGPQTDPAAQNSQSPPERSGSTENRSEADSVMTSKDQGVPGLEAPAGESLATDATQSIDMEAADHIARGVVRISEFAADLVLKSKGQGVMGPEAPAGKSFATGTTPSIDLQAAIARAVERMSMTEFELQDLKSKWIAHYQKNHPDGPSFAGGGLLATPFFLKDIITGNGYKWFIQENLVKQRDLGRQKDQEKREYISNRMNDMIFGW